MHATQIYRIIGGVFLVIGLISLMNTLTGLIIHGEFLWRSALYTVMDFAVAWGFFGRHRWLMLLLLINAIGQLTLVYTRFNADPVLPTLYFPLFGAGLAVGLFFFTYVTRDMLRWSMTAYLVGGLFLIAWSTTFSYTVVTWLQRIL